MRLVTFSNEDRADDKGHEVVAIDDMAFLFASDYEEDKGEGGTIRFLYGAHDVWKNTLFFTVLFKVDLRNDTDKKIIESLKESGAYLDEDSNGFEYSKIAFMLSSMEGDGVMTDLICTYIPETDMYEFYGASKESDEGETQMKKYTIAKDIMTGIHIMNQCVKTNSYSSKGLYEINLWLSAATDCHKATYSTCQSITILDISKANKISRTNYTGAVAMAVYVKKADGTFTTLNCVMMYSRATKVKGKNALELRNMSEKYKDVYNIGLYAGSDVTLDNSSNNVYLIAFKEKDFNVITVREDIYDKFVGEVEAI